MGNPYTGRLVPQSFVINSSDITSGDQEFVLDVGLNPPPTNIIEYFYFVDTNGDPVAATGGTVTILGSSDNGVTYQNFNDNSFDADQAISPSRRKPSGVGRTTNIRVTLAGVTAAGATGFTFMINQITGV